jgi:hypothetical protein
MPPAVKNLSGLPSAVYLAAIYALMMPQLACAENTSNSRWIQGSWVNVRTTAAADAPVTAHITTNTQVTLMAQRDKACEIAWGQDQHGFVPCKLLGERALTLAEVANRQNPDANLNPQYAPARAFWIAPSMAALFAAGKNFQQTLLSPEQLALEEGGQQPNTPNNVAPRLVRYPVPEFDAMKALLAKGLIASPDINPPLLTCKQMQAVEEAHYKEFNAPLPQATQSWSEWQYPHIENFPYAYMPVSDCRIPELPSLRLPAITPSLFKSSKEIAPASAGTERIGANFGIMEHGRVTGGPKWELDYDTMRYTGAWDIGRYELTLDKPVVEHVIGRTGLVGAYQWTPQDKQTPYGPSGGCDEGLRNKRNGKELLAGYPHIKDELMWFQSPVALPFRTAKIKSRIEHVPAVQGANGDSGIRRVAVYEIDLNGDGIPDFVQWDIWGEPQISGPDPMITLREVFVNINGEWYPFDQDAFGECT